MLGCLPFGAIAARAPPGEAARSIVVKEPQMPFQPVGIAETAKRPSSAYAGQGVELNTYP